MRGLIAKVWGGREGGGRGVPPPTRLILGRGSVGLCEYRWVVWTSGFGRWVLVVGCAERWVSTVGFRSLDILNVGL